MQIYDDDSGKGDSCKGRRKQTAKRLRVGIYRENKDFRNIGMRHLYHLIILCCSQGGRGAGAGWGGGGRDSA